MSFENGTTRELETYTPFVNDCRPRLIFRSRLHLHRVPYFPLETVIFQIDKSRRLILFSWIFSNARAHTRTHTHVYIYICWKFFSTRFRDGTLSMVPRQIKRDLNFQRATNYHRVPVNRAFDAFQLGIFRLQRATTLIPSIDQALIRREKGRERERGGERDVNNS